MIECWVIAWISLSGFSAEPHVERDNYCFAKKEECKEAIDKKKGLFCTKISKESK